MSNNFDDNFIRLNNKPHWLLIYISKAKGLIFLGSILLVSVMTGGSYVKNQIEEAIKSEVKIQVEVTVMSKV